MREHTSIGKDRIFAIPGYYEDSLKSSLYTTLKLKEASIVMIDCDLFSTTKSVLEFITHLIVDGTILIFDDWFAYKGHPYRGQRRATAEWLELNPKLVLSEFASRGHNQKAFIVNLI